MKLPSLANLKENKSSSSIKKIVTGVLTAAVLAISTHSSAMSTGNDAVSIQPSHLEVERVITLVPDDNGLLSAYHSSHRSHSSHQSHSSHSSHYSCTPGVTC